MGARRFYEKQEEEKQKVRPGEGIWLQTNDP